MYVECGVLFLLHVSVCTRNKRRRVDVVFVLSPSPSQFGRSRRSSVRLLIALHFRSSS